jgi:hypothetical protein
MTFTSKTHIIMFTYLNLKLKIQLCPENQTLDKALTKNVPTNPKQFLRMLIFLLCRFDIISLLNSVIIHG